MPDERPRRWTSRLLAGLTAGRAVVVRAVVVRAVIARVVSAVSVSAVCAAVVAAPVVVAAPAAHAAVPDTLGFALFTPVSVTLPDVWPAGTSVAAVAPGHYAVRFPGQAARGGVVHVTAVNDTPHWCQAEKWTTSGADEIVYVACYKAGGTPDASGFSVLFTSSTGPLPPSPGPVPNRYGYVDAQASGLINSQYNSSGLANGVSHTATGAWLVKLPGLGTPAPRAGSLQATAVNASVPAYCAVANWASTASDQQVKVSCIDRGGSPLDTEFTLSYQYQASLYGGAYPPKYFGYVGNLLSIGPVAGPTDFNSVTGTASNTVTPLVVGQWLVTFPYLAQRPDNVQVTALAGRATFCALTQPWVVSGADTVVKTVACYTVAGTPVDSPFLISDNSAF
ncbi:hypothetical protein [Rugosimonospora africana]|nr:hypothetical protein [Rugosimonospora africana]